MSWEQGRARTVGPKVGSFVGFSGLLEPKAGLDRGCCSWPEAGGSLCPHSKEGPHSDLAFAAGSFRDHARNVSATELTRVKIRR